MSNSQFGGRVVQNITTGLQWIKNNPIAFFVECISIFFIILWTYAAESKLQDFELFKFQLGRSPYLENYAVIISRTLPIGELLIAISLIIPVTKKIGLYASFFLMFLFTGYIYAMLHYSYYVPCSCGGILNNLSWEAHLIFNIVVTLLSLIAILYSGKVTTRTSNIKNQKLVNPAH